MSRPEPTGHPPGPRCATLWARRWGLGQRIALVIGLDLALTAIGGYITSSGPGPAQFGWFDYAPPNNAFLPVESDLSPVGQLSVWLGLIAVWTVASMRLLQRPD